MTSYRVEGLCQRLCHTLSRVVPKLKSTRPVHVINNEEMLGKAELDWPLLHSYCYMQAIKSIHPSSVLPGDPVLKKKCQISLSRASTSLVIRSSTRHRSRANSQMLTECSVRGVESETSASTIPRACSMKLKMIVAVRRGKRKNTLVSNVATTNDRSSWYVWSPNQRRNDRQSTFLPMGKFQPSFWFHSGSAKTTAQGVSTTEARYGPDFQFWVETTSVIPNVASTKKDLNINAVVRHLVRGYL